MTRRMLQNVAAIEKDLKLLPTVSNQIGIIHEEETENELQGTFSKPKRRLIDKMSAESPDFPKRDSTDEVHRAQQNLKDGLTLLSSTESERFEECQLSLKENPFGNNQSRVYIDDMTSSSG